MPTFPTPEPIAVTIDIIGDVRIIASDRPDTVVAVRPSDPSKGGDVLAAEETVVECSGDRLLVKTPKSWRHYTPLSGNRSVDVGIELPTGSRVTADSALGHISADGELGECRLKTAMGNIRLDETRALRAATGFGHLSVDRILGDAELKTGSGDVHVEVIDGGATVKNSNGDTTIDDVGGDLRVKAANGDVIVGLARASAVAKTANGDIRIAQVRQGTVVVETAAGELEVGVQEGTAAWLELVTRFGTVRNTLEAGGAPTPAEATVTIRANTAVGDIVIGRSPVDDQADRDHDRSDVS